MKNSEMITIPMALENEESYVLFIIMRQSNIDRIKAYDPAVIDLDFMPRDFKRLDLSSIQLLYASDEEMEELKSHPEQAPEMLKRLSRGFAFRPELGDGDGPYKTIGPFMR
jgi:hypothetical protein